MINKIVTNSQGVEESKDPTDCNVFALYKLFASEDQQNTLADRYRAGGMGWGDAKRELFEVMNEQISPMRKVYDELIGDRTQLDAILKDGADRAREIASKKIIQLRSGIGIA